MAKRKQERARSKPLAPLYYIGPDSIEFSTDLVNFDSFGEYASYCHATGKK